MESDLNIDIFIGNGFDIALLKSLSSPFDTRFVSFFNYYTSCVDYNQKNTIVLQMKHAKEMGCVNWSDVEFQLKELLNKDRDYKELERDLLEIQLSFSAFLNKVVSRDIIKKVSDIHTSFKSYAYFFNDLSKEQYLRCKTHNKIVNHSKVRFSFFNFNYTTLFDNYIYLDEFDPNPFSSSLNNARLIVNPYKYPGHTDFYDAYCRVLSEVLHPHGHQAVPKSMILATETDCHEENEVNDELTIRPVVNRDNEKRKFIKSLSARCCELYLDRIWEGNLFIIYGCSIGESDSWWWSRILYTLIQKEDSELIIYYFGKEDEKTVIQKYFDSCCINKNAFMNEIFKSANIEAVKERIFVVSYDETKKVDYLNVNVTSK